MMSVPKLAQAPADRGAEVAFAGRSNAGKSSAINTITRRKSLARTSKTPGRTQQLVFFCLDDDHRLVDLPGYGFAKVPEGIRREWGQLMANYLSQRRSLRGLVLLMDTRHPLTDFDQQMLGWCENTCMPVHILLTKADKLKRGATKNVLLKVQRCLSQQPLCSVQLFSATHNHGVDEVRETIATWLNQDDRPF